MPPFVRELREPLAIAALAALCYLCFAFMFIAPLSTGADYIGRRFFDEIRAGDDLIPEIFAQKIYGRESLRPFCCGDWLTSDRPPLQTGIFLMQRPLPFAGSVDFNYELMAAGLQCLWICGVWMLMASLGTSLIQRRRVVILLLFSGFLFYNSVYVWPKLLAATFILFALSILFDCIRSRRILNLGEAFLFATCVSLAFLAHPGSIFSLAAFAVILVRFRRLFPLKLAALSLLILTLFVVPWSAYQKFVDPPGNRLLKIHLAGVIGIDSRSTFETLRAVYSGTPLSTLALNRWSNLRTLMGFRVFDTFGLGEFTRAQTELSRTAQREWVWNAVGLVNLGWLCAAWACLRHSLMRRRNCAPTIPHSGWLIAAATANLILWALVTFGPNETVTTHGSYADILLLSVGLLGYICQLPGFALASLLALQIFNLAVVWIWSPPYHLATFGGISRPVQLQVPLLVLGSAFAVVLVWHLAPSLFLQDPAKDSGLSPSTEPKLPLAPPPIDYSEA